MELAQGLAMKQYNITKDQNLKKFNNVYVVKLPRARSTNAKTHNLFPKRTSTTSIQCGIHIVFKGVNTKKGAKNHVG